MTGRPETPLRRTSSLGPSPSSHLRTPGRGSRLGGSELRTNALTPHGRAALREVEARRAGLTPGKDRRRSGMQQRETPRDILRLLSRTLAPQTLPTVPSPQRAPSNSRRQTLLLDDDFDDDPKIVPPRLSLPLDDENEDDDDYEDDESLLLPSLAALEEENLTTRSIELPRRAINEQPNRLFSRGSFGSIRESHRFGNLNEAELDRDVMGSSFFEGNGYEHDDFPDMENSPFFGSERAEMRGDFEAGLHRRSLLPGRSSDIRPYNSPSEERDATFVFTVPQPEFPVQLVSSPSPETTQIGDPAMDNPSSPLEDIPGGNFAMDEEATNGENDSPRLSIGTFENSRLSDFEDFREPLPKSIPETLRAPQKKKNKVSKHGLKYSSLPLGVVKKHASNFARNGASKGEKLSRDALDAIMQATDWFFEQISEDLGTYSEHAGRKTIDKSDVLMLMKRQRQTNATTTPFSLAQSRLPRELLQDVRMIPPLISRDRPRKKASGK